MRTQRNCDELQSIRFKQKKLIARRIGDELLLFEEETSIAHCLNRIAGEMWMACERESSATEVSELLRPKWPDIGREVVLASLHQMAAAGVLEESRVKENISSSRRELLRTLGITAAAVLPIVVTSVLIPPPAAAASCGRLLQACTVANPCCSGLHCVLGVCQLI